MPLIADHKTCLFLGILFFSITHHTPAAINPAVTGAGAATGIILTAILGRIAHTRAAKLSSLRTELKRLRAMSAFAVTSEEKAVLKEQITVLQKNIEHVRTVREDMAIGSAIAAVASLVAGIHAVRGAARFAKKPMAELQSAAFTTPAKPKRSLSEEADASTGVPENPSRPPSVSDGPAPASLDLLSKPLTPAEAIELAAAKLFTDTHSEDMQWSKLGEPRKNLFKAHKESELKEMLASTIFFQSPDETKPHDGEHNHATPLTTRQ